MKTKVAIFGGGVAGMSAAHELAERGFAVEVYERQPRYVGGKARSTDVPHSAAPGQAPLPGEHGFRFFPGFYRHITDTMKRIPYPGNAQGVFDNLVMTTRVMMTRFGKKPIVSIVNFPKTLDDWKTVVEAVLTADTGLTTSDKEVFAARIWQLLTSSYERRQQVYERIAWWQYMSTDQQCGTRQPCPYEEYCVGGLTHSLVAAQPKLMSTKTGGDILLQLLLLMANPSAHTDRVLNGPTNDVWLFPWLRHLQSLGVTYYHHHLTTEFHCDPQTQQINGVTVVNLDTHEARLVQADYYISAVPLERMALLINPQMLAVDATLGFIVDLAQPSRHSLNWMNGVQYYLNQDVPLTNGHVICIDSPWALTVISQPQFWPKFPMSGFGDGQVKGLLSVDVSDWFAPGLNGKAASECTLPEIIDEVWNQLEKSLNNGDAPLISRSMILRANVDSDIKEEDGQLRNPTVSAHDAEPLLVNTANSWSLRPEAATGIRNLFLASDYVRTNTDLATMEGANEAARRAVNGILAASGSSAPYCEIWPLHEPDILAIPRWFDRRRFARGLPWTGELPWIGRVLHTLNYYYHKLRGFRQ
ncbi:NAD(P)-binding protein [Hymenobacter lutimineralis]|uniref:NAD(P)-binding protein n=1 Tax=Hymenobacter lutimineralis TaxID=2606448 RepID=A0A5D6UY32_9BACT|nr:MULTISPECIES: FAD-dependent oxidoreductase [Hymenobacter]QIX59840.1 NAD(P)-binding protein [Hymenobacter sp. BT18]TYZ08406.1 NAD(P)-binding protein [Hymenobacter lutimineralis]